MTATITDCFGDNDILSDPQEAVKLFDELTVRIMPSGRPGQAIWFGTEGNPEILRIDVDVDKGRAALRWLPDGTHAVELEPGPAIETYATDDGEIAHIPGALARVSPATARRAVTEFVATGKRPTCVSWDD